MEARPSMYISNLRSNPKYPQYKGHHWADFIELLCLANIDNEISKTDLIDRFAERASDLGEGDIDDFNEMEILEEEDNQQATRRALKTDLWDKRIEDLFKVIEHRVSIYGVNYPFSLEGNSIKLIKPQLEGLHLLYAYLLFCSNLFLFEAADRLELANNFELLCLNALKNILPETAVVELFGKNPLNKGVYSGSLWGKIERLAETLNEKVHHGLSSADYPLQNTGDDGLDLVGYIPSGDLLPSKLIFFGQCACTPEEWISKQNSSAHNAWKNKISITTSINNIVFIPFCFRNATGMWVNIGDIHDSLLIDRRRLIFYFGESLCAFEDLPAFELVHKYALAKEDVF